MLNLPVCRWSKTTRPESGASLVVGISASSMGSVWARPKAISVSDISSIFQLKPVLSGHVKNLCWMYVCSSWRCDRNWAGRWVWWPYLKVLLCWATLRKEDFLSWFKNNIIVLQNKKYPKIWALFLNIIFIIILDVQMVFFRNDFLYFWVKNIFLHNFLTPKMIFKSDCKTLVISVSPQYAYEYVFILFHFYLIIYSTYFHDDKKLYFLTIK